MKGTDPNFVNYEMDIFWIVFAHHDPVKWLHRYPGRFPLMHVKDIRKDTPLGGSPGDVLEEASVILGQGLVDIPAALRAAEATGHDTIRLKTKPSTRPNRYPKACGIWKAFGRGVPDTRAAASDRRSQNIRTTTHGFLDFERLRYSCVRLDFFHFS